MRCPTSPRRALALGIGLAVLAPGLRARAADLAPVEALVLERTGATLAWTRDGAPSGALKERLAGLLAGELGAEEAVQVALLQNRFLQAELRELSVAEAERAQAGQWKNPELDLDMRFPGRALELAVKQDVVDFWLRPLRQRQARRQLRSTQLLAAHAVLGLAAEVRSAYYQLVAAQLVRGLFEESLAAARASADLARRQRAAGNISDLVLDNHEAMEEESRLELAASESALLQAQAGFAALLGMHGAGPGELRTGSEFPRLPAADPTLVELEEQALANRLDLAAAAEELRAAEQGPALARLERWHALEVGILLEREADGERSIGPALTLSLPIFDRGRAAGAAARARLEQHQERRAALEAQIRAQVRAARLGLEAARDRERHYREQVLPRRQRIVAKTQREYNYMLVGVYDLIEAKQKETAARRAAIEAGRDYWLARVELAREVGGSLDAAAPATLPVSPDAPLERGQP